MLETVDLKARLTKTEYRKAQEKLGDAREYATKVVENARANVDYIESLLPEYRERPKLVLQQIYLDALENILNNAEEKFFIQPTEGAEGKEIRVLLNRDPSLKRQRSGSEGQTQENQ